MLFQYHFVLLAAAFIGIIFPENAAQPSGVRKFLEPSKYYIDDVVLLYVMKALREAFKDIQEKCLREAAGRCKAHWKDIRILVK
ncbi:uncharacterized protein LOC106657041 isoform X2 [Trichogramma pretiosum]|nr:uncharacterized protein LOC106657041 isoform X2 [Trichogramma pretiosum]